MTPTEYQQRAAALDNHSNNEHRALGLAAEAGEVAGLFQKADYKEERVDGPRLFDELSDVLWYLTRIASSCGWDLEQLMQHNIEKLEERHGK